MNRKIIVFSVIIFLTIFLFEAKSLSSHNPKSNHIESILLNNKNPVFSYNKIKKLGEIRVGVIFNPTSFFIYRGVLMGFEYDLISIFAKRENLKLKLVIKENLSELIEELNSGNIDIIASGIINTKQMGKKVLFTEYYTTSRQVLVQKKSKNSIHNHVELIGKIINIPKNSPSYTRLQNLSEEIGGDILVDTSINIPTENLIELVANDSIKFTISEERVAKINQKYYRQLDISLPISFPQKLSWAVNKKSKNLKKVVDSWIKEEKNKGTIKKLYRKYFTNRKLYSKRLNSEYMIYKLGNEFKISQYDSLLKFHSKEIGWDWRLLSSMMYEESKFQKSARSWAGAIGLFQLMPLTAKEFGGKNMFNPNDNIKTAMKFIKDLQRQWEFIEDKNERIKFVLASYNAGSGHVHDARRLTKKYGKNGEIWDNNTAIFIKNLMEKKYYTDRVVRYGYCRGSETYNYVDKIIKRYNKYKNMSFNNVDLDSL